MLNTHRDDVPLCTHESNIHEALRYRLRENYYNPKPLFVKAV